MTTEAKMCDGIRRAKRTALEKKEDLRRQIFPPVDNGILELSLNATQFPQAFRTSARVY